MIFFKRIGSEKRTFNITLVPIRLEAISKQYTDLCITFSRGQHVVVSSVNKAANRQVAFKEERLEVKATMYYNNNTKSYVQKRAKIVVKGKHLGGIQIYDLDTFEFDLSEYVDKAKQRVKFEFDSGIKLTANIEFSQNQKNTQNSSQAPTSQRVITEKQNKIINQRETYVERTMAKSMKTLPVSQQIGQKERELDKVKQQNRRLNSVINQLSEKNLPSSFSVNQNVIDKLYDENQSLKKKIVQLQIQLSRSETKIKRMNGGQSDASKTVKEQAIRIKDLQQQLQQSKNKMATLLQDCFEQGDAELVSFIEQRIKK